jgi:hypothetical protein
VCDGCVCMCVCSCPSYTAYVSTLYESKWLPERNQHPTPGINHGLADVEKVNKIPLKVFQFLLQMYVVIVLKTVVYYLIDGITNCLNT